MLAIARSLAIDVEYDNVDATARSICANLVRRPCAWRVVFSQKLKTSFMNNSSIMANFVANVRNTSRSEQPNSHEMRDVVYA